MNLFSNLFPPRKQKKISPSPPPPSSLSPSIDDLLSPRDIPPPPPPPPLPRSSSSSSSFVIDNLFSPRNTENLPLFSTQQELSDEKIKKLAVYISLKWMNTDENQTIDFPVTKNIRNQILNYMGIYILWKIDKIHAPEPLYLLDLHSHTLFQELSKPYARYKKIFYCDYRDQSFFLKKLKQLGFYIHHNQELNISIPIHPLHCAPLGVFHWIQNPIF